MLQIILDRVGKSIGQLFVNYSTRHLSEPFFCNLVMALKAFSQQIMPTFRREFSLENIQELSQDGRHQLRKCILSNQ